MPCHCQARPETDMHREIVGAGLADGGRRTLMVQKISVTSGTLFQSRR